LGAATSAVSCALRIIGNIKSPALCPCFIKIPTCFFGGFSKTTHANLNIITVQCAPFIPIFINPRPIYCAWRSMRMNSLPKHVLRHRNCVTHRVCDHIRIIIGKHNFPFKDKNKYLRESFNESSARSILQTPEEPLPHRDYLKFISTHSTTRERPSDYIPTAGVKPLSCWTSLTRMPFTFRRCTPPGFPHRSDIEPDCKPMQHFFTCCEKFLIQSYVPANLHKALAPSCVCPTLTDLRASC